MENNERKIDTSEERNLRIWWKSSGGILLKMPVSILLGALLLLPSSSTRNLFACGCSATASFSCKVHNIKVDIGVFGLREKVGKLNFIGNQRSNLIGGLREDLGFQEMSKIFVFVLRNCHLSASSGSHTDSHQTNAIPSLT